jgi:hypothetical protein
MHINQDTVVWTIARPSIGDACPFVNRAPDAQGMRLTAEATPGGGRRRFEGAPASTGGGRTIVAGWLFG